MSKTLFSDGNPLSGILGTIVNAAFLNKIFAHRHDGLDQDGSAPINYAVDSGDDNAVVIALVPPLTAHIPGMSITIKVNFTNTAACSVQIDELDAVAIKRPDGSDLLPGDIRNNQLISIYYTGSVYQMQALSSADVPESTLTDQATIAWSWNTHNNAKITLGGNRTLAAPSGLAAGKYASLRIAQDATGSRALALAANYKGVAELSLSTDPNAVDWLLFRAVDATNCELIGYRTNVGA